MTKFVSGWKTGVFRSLFCAISQVRPRRFFLFVCLHVWDVTLFDYTTFFGIAGQEMDGKAIAFGLASSPGHDWLKDVVPALGLRLKVHNALRTLVNVFQVSELCKFRLACLRFDSNFN